MLPCRIRPSTRGLGSHPSHALLVKGRASHMAATMRRPSSSPGGRALTPASPVCSTTGPTWTALRRCRRGGSLPAASSGAPVPTGSRITTVWPAHPGHQATGPSSCLAHRSTTSCRSWLLTPIDRRTVAAARLAYFLSSPTQTAVGPKLHRSPAGEPSLRGAPGQAVDDLDGQCHRTSCEVEG